MATFSALLAICAGNSPHKGQWRGALMFTLICARINGWVNNREGGDLRRHRAHYDVIVMIRIRLNQPIWFQTVIIIFLSVMKIQSNSRLNTATIVLNGHFNPPRWVYKLCLAIVETSSEPRGKRWQQAPEGDALQYYYRMLHVASEARVCTLNTTIKCIFTHFVLRFLNIW